MIEFPKWKSKEISFDQEMLHKITTYEKILFTSAESVTHFFEILSQEKFDLRSLSAELFGLSQKTVTALNEKGLMAEVVDEIEQNEPLLVVGDNRVNKYHYANFDVLITSENIIDEKYLTIIKRMITEATPDTIVFPSAQSVKMFFEEELVANLFPPELIHNVNVVCMGDRTWNAAQFYGVQPQAKPETPTTEALMECIANFSIKN